MELKEIKKHWETLAEKYAEDLKSTTKTSTIKKLEINAIQNTIKQIINIVGNVNILEVGCGNGHNLIELSKKFGQYDFDGLDYSSQMIENAEKIKKQYKISNLNFLVGDILDIEKNNNLRKEYDIVFTDRCLINLNTVELQKKGIEQIVKKIKKEGYLILIENVIQTYNAQNTMRESIGLTKRIPDEYNLFIDENEILSYMQKKLNLKLLEVNDFGSLHDIILYVLLPKINNGNIDYTHPIMEAVTELSIETSINFKNSFGSFGQNRLYLLKKLENN